MTKDVGPSLSILDVNKSLTVIRRHFETHGAYDLFYALQYKLKM